MSYYSFHNHTDFSNASCGFMDSINKTEDLINYAYTSGLRGIAITDHESVSSHVRAVQHYKSMLDKAKNNPEELEKVKNFRLLLGNEVYLARPDLTRETHKKGEKFYHMILVAKDKIGHKQIRELSSKAWGRAYYMAIQRRYNIGPDFEEVIVPNRGHIIATTACLGGATGSYFLNNSEQEAKVLIDSFLSRMDYVFGHENFFIELAPSKYKEQIEYNKFMYKNYNDKYNFVITTDSHYLNESDFDLFKVILNTGDGEREVEDFYKYSHVMTWEQILSFFDYLPAAFLERCRMNTIRVGEQAEFYDLKEPSRIPQIPVDEKQVLTQVPHGGYVYENIRKFFESPHKQDRHYLYKIFEHFDELISKNKIDETLERIDLELSEVWGISEALNQRMSDYLLTVSKVIELMWDEADAIVGPGRGSAVAFVTNYLLGITQLNPMEYPVPIYHWRFIEKSRPDLPDIDIDTAGNKRENVISAVSRYFESIGGSLTQIATYGTEGAKSAIRTAARGLNIEDEIALYASSLVPAERGIQLSLDQCYYGDEDHEPIAAFVATMNTYPELWNVSRKIEGLVTRLGIHAAGVILGNQPITTHNSVMRTSKGFMVTAFDLHDSEYLGEVKYDFLSIDGLGKVNAALNFMLKDNVIEWKGSLKETYKYYLWPNKLQYTDALWDNVAANRINSLWQLNTDVGTQALGGIHATSLKEIGMINSLMRLMPQNKGDEQPIKTFERYRNDISLWYQEMRANDLNEEEVKILEDHLLILNGIADTQESVMQLVMDPRISGFNIAEANKLRKGIAKKSLKAQEEAKTLFYEKGKQLGTRRALLSYVWDVQISRQLGYSFSLPHVAAYSIIAMQQANLYTYYPSIYWNTACLTIDAGANQEEDLQDLIKKGYLKPSIHTQDLDEDDEEGTKEIETSAIDRGKIAAAIGAFQRTTKIEPPDINTSGFGFTPDKNRNVITCGLKIVSKIGDQLIYQIVYGRPYLSFEEFVDSVAISKDRVVNLIKADAFRNIDKRDRMTLLKDYVRDKSDLKKRLTLQNLAMLINYNLIPNDQFGHQIKVYNWVKYIRKMKHNTYYRLDERALNFYETVLSPARLEYQNVNDEYTTLVSMAYVDKYYETEMAKIKSYISSNHNELLAKLNERIFLEEWDKYKMDTVEQGEMQSTRMYVHEHELADVSLPYEISALDKIQDDEQDGNFYIEGKFFPRYVIHHIVGTVIDKNKTKHKITLLTPEGPTEVKIWKNQFAFYDQTLVDTSGPEKRIIQDSFFEIGTHLMVSGIKRGNTFVLKKYKFTKVEDVIMKITLTEDGYDNLEAKIKQEDLHS